MNIATYIDPEILNFSIEEGFVMVKKHSKLPLTLLSYTRKTVYDDVWNDATTKCRGLIVNSITGEIVARPFEKFFNYGQGSWGSGLIVAGMCNETPVVSEKLDGSLGIFWQYDGHWGVASKGSFDSPHAQWATDWLAQHIEENGPLVWPKNHTPVFEMICESVETHVVSYGGTNDLILLALVNNETGEEMGPEDVDDYARRNKLHRVGFYRMTLEQALSLDRPNHEGFVISYPIAGQPPFKVKVKHETFLKYQKLVHSATPKNTLNMLKAGKQAEIVDMLDVLPRHVAEKISLWQLEYLNEYDRVHTKASELCYDALKNFTTRAEIANWLHSDPERSEYSGICFAILDQKREYVDRIWRLVGSRVDITNTIEAGD